jgi:anaerobic selenocysteine-containing dehydrogenase
VGANLASQPNTARHVTAARRRGASIITIDVRQTDAHRPSDETFIVRPGSDAALALAMMHVIVAEELWDREFVAHTRWASTSLAGHVATPLAGVGG